MTLINLKPTKRTLNIPHSHLKLNGGSALVFSVLLVGVILSISLTLLTIFLSKVKVSGDIRRSVPALYAADSGLEHCLYTNRIDPVPQGLISYWKFDEGSGNTAFDSSGNGWHGTLEGPNWNNGGCYRSSCLQFDGNNDSVNIGTAWDVTNTDFSIAFWIKLDDFDDWGTILGKLSSWTAGNTRFTLAVDDNDREVNFGSYLDDPDIFTVEIPIGVWSHYVVTNNVDESARTIYYSGVTESVVSDMVLDSATNAPTRIGGAGNGDLYNLDGALDDIRVYNRTLTPQEASKIYNWTVLPRPVFLNGASYSVDPYDCYGSSFKAVGKFEGVVRAFEVNF